MTEFENNSDIYELKAEDKQSFTECFRQMCKDSDVKLKELADCLEVSNAAITQFMNGLSLPSVEQLNKMLLKMNISAFDAGIMRYRLINARNGRGSYDNTAESKTLWPLSQNYIPDGMPDSPEILFGDPGTLLSVPMISLDDMQDYSSQEPLYTYAVKRQRHAVTRDFGTFGKPIIIETCGKRINLPFCGEIHLVVAEALPEGYSSIDLCCFSDNTYCTIPQDDNADWKNFSGPPPVTGKLKWRLPLLEMCLNPLSRKDENSEE